MSQNAKYNLDGGFVPSIPRRLHSSEQAVADQRLPTDERSLAGTRVLFISPQPFYEDRGSPIAVLQVVRAMSELGMHVDLMAFPPGQAVDVENLRIFRCGESLRITDVPIGFSLKKVLLDVAMVFSVRSRLKAARYDCVHTLEDGIYVALAARLAGRIPIICDMASCIPEQLSTHPVLGSRIAQWILKRMELFALRRATTVSCSLGLKRHIKSRAPEVSVTEWSFSDPVTNINSDEREAAAMSLRRDLGIHSNAPVILYAGNFKDYQGVEMLVEAIPIVRQAHPDAVLVLLGARANDDIEQLESRCDGAIVVCPGQPREQVGDYLHMAQILVSPRKWGANLPLKLFEYLAAGRPIVATDNEHHRLLLNDERAVFAHTSPDGLASEISQLLDDPGKMERLARAARKYSESELGWANFVDCVSRLYNTALHPRAE